MQPNLVDAPPALPVRDRPLQESRYQDTSQDTLLEDYFFESSRPMTPQVPPPQPGMAPVSQMLGDLVAAQPRVKLYGTPLARYYWRRALDNAATTVPVCAVSFRRNENERRRAVLLDDMAEGSYRTHYHIPSSVTCVALDPSAENIYLREYQQTWPHFVYAIIPGSPELELGIGYKRYVMKMFFADCGFQQMWMLDDNLVFYKDVTNHEYHSTLCQRSLAEKGKIKGKIVDADKTWRAVDTRTAPASAFEVIEWFQLELSNFMIREGAAIVGFAYSGRPGPRRFARRGNDRFAKNVWINLRQTADRQYVPGLRYAEDKMFAERLIWPQRLMAFKLYYPFRYNWSQQRKHVDMPLTLLGPLAPAMREYIQSDPKILAHEEKRLLKKLLVQRVRQQLRDIHKGSRLPRFPDGVEMLASVFQHSLLADGACTHRDRVQIAKALRDTPGKDPNFRELFEALYQQCCQLYSRAVLAGEVSEGSNIDEPSNQSSDESGSDDDGPDPLEDGPSNLSEDPDEGGVVPHAPGGVPGGLGVEKSVSEMSADDVAMHLQIIEVFRQPPAMRRFDYDQGLELSKGVFADVSALMRQKHKDAKDEANRRLREYQQILKDEERRRRSNETSSRTSTGKSAKEVETSVPPRRRSRSRSR